MHQIYMKVDVSKAFKTTDRSAFLRQILTHSPEIYPLLRLVQSPFFKQTRILCEPWLQQGDPLASLAFLLVLNYAVNSIDCEYNVYMLMCVQILRSWYAVLHFLLSI